MSDTRAKMGRNMTLIHPSGRYAKPSNLLTLVSFRRTVRRIFVRGAIVDHHTTNM